MWDDDCWKERERLVYTAHMNRLYHQRHERFLALLDRSGKALALIAGSAAASALLDTTLLKAIAGAVVACVTLPSLVFAWADRARLHAELAAEYTRFEADVVAFGEMEQEDIDKMNGRLTLLGAKEPPVLASLVVSCQNELAVAANQKELIVPLNWPRRWFKHVFSMPLGDDKKDASGGKAAPAESA